MCTVGRRARGAQHAPARIRVETAVSLPAVHPAHSLFPPPQPSPEHLFPHQGLGIVAFAAASATGGPLSASAKSPPSHSPIVYCEESVMSKKSHGTTEASLDASSLRWGVDSKLADKICSFNRHFAEPGGSFEKNEAFLAQVEALKPGETITFYDTVSQKPLFVAPVNRTPKEVRVV